jgi:predicted dehydrogenase/nucleoside-diphosphate-sugar epimerase
MGAHHARALATIRTADVRLVAIADPSPAARRDVEAIIPGIAEYDSLDALLTGTSVDVIHICTPPATHAAVARAAIAAGCHVYVEKPFCDSVAEAESILAAADAQGLLVCAGHQLLFERPARLADRLLPALGKLTHVESYFSFRTVRRAPGGRARLRSDVQLLDILPHPVYLLLHFLQRADAGPPRLASLELGGSGTVHALVRQGSSTGHLIVTLEGRPIDSYVRLVGTNGSIHADFVRGTVQHLFGPGTTGIDKIIAPYRLGLQMIVGTTAALGRRILQRKRSYPGLAELFEELYGAIDTGARSPISGDSIRETVRVCEAVAARLRAAQLPAASPIRRPSQRRVVVTGGTGFLGRALTAELVTRGASVLVLARHHPAAWERVAEVEYGIADLGEGVPSSALAGADVIVHAAAETAGGWDEHQRNSIEATERLLRKAAQAGVRRLVQVSSVAVLGRPARGPIDEQTPLEPDSRGSGPYVWGKLESERRAVSLGRELGIEVRVVRPGAIVDYNAFDPPGRLGKRVGPLFVAVGSPRDRLGVVDLAFSAQVLAWIATHFDQAPPILNLLAPDPPMKRDLIRELRRANPDLRIVWLPWPLLVPLSGAATLLQRLIRRSRPAINLRRVFGCPRYNTQTVRELRARIAP